MPEQLLDCLERRAAHDEMRGERVASDMPSDPAQAGSLARAPQHLISPLFNIEPSIRQNTSSPRRCRCWIVDGDLRDDLVEGAFDLVTGTPPYFPCGSGTESDKTHAAAARFEHRGGVEDYLAVAAKRVTDLGRIAICSSALERDRVAASVRALGLAHREHSSIVPKQGKDVLVVVDVTSRAPGEPEHHRLVVRDGDRRWIP